MSFRKRVAFFVMFLVVSLPFAARAQQAAAAGGTVHGMVVDPDDALIPGATVTLTPASGKSQTTTSKSDGTYSFRGVAAGTYTVNATAPGFADYSSAAINVANGANVNSDVKMTLATAAQTVNVTTDTVQLSVDPENNASSTVISGDALNALSDDPDELQSELEALAGPSAGPNGGQIYIDGFTGGQLPPKSSILAIRINSNPFSAQYDQLGYGRIEILTKPGTDKFHGSGSFQGMDKVFNTNSPFLNGAAQPDYHTLFALGNVTGPIRPGMSFSMGGSYRDMANNNIINPAAIYSSSPSSTTVCAPGDLTCSVNPYPAADRAAPAPAYRWDIGPRFDTMIGSKNTLTTRFEYERGTNQNNGGGNSLPSLGSRSASDELTLQLSDTQVLSNAVINETRFEYQRDNSNSTPLSTAPEVTVQGNFSTNGTGGGNLNSNTQTHYEFQNYTSIQLTKNFVRLGGRLRSTSEANTSNSDVNGSLLYSFLLDPCTDPSIVNKPSACAQLVTTSPCAYASLALPSGVPNFPSSYQCGIVAQFSQTTINNLTINARETDVGLYAEDDWKVTPNFTWSYGIRLEAQNYINSTHDFAPRTSLAWGIPRKNGKTTTVLRAGAGIFYDRFQLGSIANIIQSNPLNQSSAVLQYPNVGCSPTDIAACTGGSGSSSQSRIPVPVAATNLRAPYTIEAAATVEQQVGKYASVSVTYLNAHGEHQFLTRPFNIGNDSHCVTPSGVSTAGLQLNCDESAGVYRQNQINTNINVRTPKGTSIFGYYSLNWANSNTSVTNPFNSATDYGRASFAVRSRLNIGGTIPLPFQITASPLIFAQSGNPYNVTTGTPDLITLGFDRAAWNPANGPVPTRGTWAQCTNSSNFETNSSPFGLAGTLPELPAEFCTGPANVSVNLRLTRTFGFGPRTEPTNGQGNGRGQGGGQFGGIGGGPGGGGGGRGGGFGGGGGGGRGGGGFGGGRGSNTGRKYNLTIGAQALNLFNEIPYGTPVSNLSNSHFGQQITLSGGQFASANAVRRITLQANFNF